MKILVCITHVPDTTSKISFQNNNTQFNGAGVQFIIGPYDEYALSKALDIKEATGATITVLHVGETEADATIRKALALGADDAVRINAVPKDSLFTAQQIVSFAKDKSFDLIMMGRESIDFNGGMVHSMVAEMLNIPCVVPVMTLDLQGNTARITREIEGGKEIVEADLPLVLGCQEPIAEWKIPGMRGIMAAKTKPLQIIDPVNTESISILDSFELPAARSGVKMIDASNPGELVTLLQKEAKII